MSELATQGGSGMFLSYDMSLRRPWTSLSYTGCASSRHMQFVLSCIQKIGEKEEKFY